MDVIKIWKLNGIRESILYCFTSENSPGFKNISKAEKLHYEKKTLVIFLAIFLADDDRCLIDINGGTITFTLFILQKWNKNELWKLKTKSFVVGGSHQSATISTGDDKPKIGENFLLFKCV